MHKTPQKRLTTVIGQLQAIVDMMDRNEDCSKVVVQCKAVSAGLSSAIAKYIEQEALDCVSARSNKSSQEKLSGLIKELAK